MVELVNFNVWLFVIMLMLELGFFNECKDLVGVSTARQADHTHAPGSGSDNISLPDLKQPSDSVSLSGSKHPDTNLADSVRPTLMFLLD